MPVFDFSGASTKQKRTVKVYLHNISQSNEKEAFTGANRSWCLTIKRQWKHHSCGVFTNPVNRTAF